MNLIGLATMGLFVCGAIASPLLLVWGGYCLTRRSRRAEAAIVLGFGAVAAGALLIVGLVTAPPHSPGLFRAQALVAVAGVFGLGAMAGKIVHVVASRRRRAAGPSKRTS